MPQRNPPTAVGGLDRYSPPLGRGEGRVCDAIKVLVLGGSLNIEINTRLLFLKGFRFDAAFTPPTT